MSDWMEIAEEVLGEPDRGAATVEGDLQETRLQEEETRALAEARVDRKSRRISSVKICGRVSQNGRVYLKPCFKEARDQYDGAMVRIDHTGKGEDVGLREAVGVVRNPQARDDGLYADMEFFEDPVADKVISMAERAADQFGSSHEAGGKVETSREGKDKVREITDVKAVALVPNPATTNSLFEELRESIEEETTDGKRDVREADMALVEQRLFRGPGYGRRSLDVQLSDSREVQESEDRDQPDLLRVRDRLFV